MLYYEYRRAAERHLSTCQHLLNSTTDRNPNCDHIFQDVYYLSGYIIETLLSYAFFRSINWSKKQPIEECEYYNQSFKTHKINLKIQYLKRHHVDLQGLSLVDKESFIPTHMKLMNNWSEVVRYRNSKDIDNKLEINKVILVKYIDEIKHLKQELLQKYF